MVDKALVDSVYRQLLHVETVLQLLNEDVGACHSTLDNNGAIDRRQIDCIKRHIESTATVIVRVRNTLLEKNQLKESK